VIRSKSFFMCSFPQPVCILQILLDGAGSTCIPTTHAPFSYPGVLTHRLLVQYNHLCFFSELPSTSSLHLQSLSLNIS
jgi:hypothetical protein